MRILTWHVHGSYLYYLTRNSPHDFFLVVGDNGSGGRGRVFPFGSNVSEVFVEDISLDDYDCILYQSRQNWISRKRIIEPSGQRIPQIYLEHDLPLGSPTEQTHPAAFSAATIVHVTPFNALMWDCGDAEIVVIDHGVSLMEPAKANCAIPLGVSAVNNICRSGRRAGPDILRYVRDAGIGVDLVGANSEELGGKGEVRPPDLPFFLSNYRFYFNPCRYTSLNLAVIEAMAVGLPIVGLATTEMASVVTSGVNGFIDTDPAKLITSMRRLIEDQDLALELGANARQIAEERFSIARFTNDWNSLFETVVSSHATVHARQDLASEAALQTR